MKCNLVLVISFMFCKFNLLSQSTLQGKVTDKDKKVLSGIEITIPQLSIGTTSDNRGDFVLKDIPKGIYKVHIGGIGWEAQSIELEFPYYNRLDIHLKENIYNIDEIVISTPFNKRQQENIINVEKINAQSLERSNSPNLITGITELPGVSQITTGLGVGKPVIRGLSGNRVVTYTQGVRFENYQFGQEHGLDVNQAGVSSVEVIKGPSSLLYGSDAIGGVIFINPESYVMDLKEFKASLLQRYFTNTNGSSSSLGLGYSGDKWRYLARFTYDTHLDYKIPNGYRVENTNFENKNAKAGILYRTDKFSTDIRYSYNESKSGIPLGEFTNKKNRSIEIPYQQVNYHILSVKNDFNIEESEIEVTLGFISNKRREFEDDHHYIHYQHDDYNHDSKEAAVDMTLNTYSLNASWNLLKTQLSETLFGVQSSFQTNVNHREEILITDSQTFDIGLYGMSLFNFDRHHLQFGVRFDSRNIFIENDKENNDNKKSYNYYENEYDEQESNISKSYQSINACLGYRYDFTSDFNAKVQVATAFRAPSINELVSDGAHHGALRYEIGDLNLVTEQNVQLDLSLSFDQKHIDFFLDAFYNNVNNYIYIEPSGDEKNGLPVFNYKQKNALLFGGEAGIHIHPHPLDFLHLKSSYEIVQGDLKNGEALPLIPASKFKNQIQTAFKIGNILEKGFVSLDWDYVLSQNKVALYEKTTPDYSLVNLNLGGVFPLRKGEIKLDASARNIFNKKYISHLSRLKEHNIPNIGRNIVIGFTYAI